MELSQRVQVRRVGDECVTVPRGLTLAPSSYDADHHFVLAEIVLAELLSSFKFEDAGKPVVWNIGEVIYPTVGQDSPVPAFPMKVTAL